MAMSTKDHNRRDQYYHSLPDPNALDYVEPLLVNHNSEFTDLKRYSAKQRNSQNLAGLMGYFSYQ